jgi:internalin A
MPTLPLPPDTLAAYEEALNKIEACRLNGMHGTHLNLSSLRLTHLPPEIGQLTALKGLALYNNQLSSLPAEIGKLTALIGLGLDNNQLSTLPPEIGQLTALRELYLSNNQLSTLPPEIGKLTALRELYLHDNQLSTLPPEIGQLTALRELYLSGNPLQEPPAAVCVQGIEAIQRYFTDSASAGTETLWRSKLMLVGQGRVGKTELRHRLMQRPHGQAISTEVMEIETVALPHPQQAGVTMELRCWDFGGQDIYHATHQFFLTGRSLFVLCFEAGKDWEAGKPYYWLDKISAVAPGAPVVVVATKGDEREAPALPWTDLKQRYPQLVGEGCFTITTKTANRKEQPGDGMAELTACLQQVAADRSKLPLMGETLPKTWIKGMDAVTNHPHDYFLKHTAFCQLLRDSGVDEESLHTVAVMLRDLGEILYYCDAGEEALHEWVIIKPTWVTRAAARILDSAEVQAKDGILTQAEMSRAWQGYPDAMQPVLLELLEKYDLTYKIPDDKEDRSLVVEKLPKAEAAAPEAWALLKPTPEGPNREMQMTFRLGSMQAGIPSWFIARKHYYTQRCHWLHGVYFGDRRTAPRHVALIRANTDPKKPELELTVRGPFPQTFFAVMKEGLEASIRDRYPKLIEKQTIPCCCQDKKPGEPPCTHAFSYERLLTWKKPTIECAESGENVSVTELLYGYANPVGSTEQQLAEMEQRIVKEVQQVGGQDG